MAPEMIAERGYDYQVDAWSLGASLFHVLYERLPYADDYTTLDEIYAAILSGGPNYPEEMIKDTDPEAKDLIEGLLVRKPNNRLTIDEVLKHPFVDQ